MKKILAIIIFILVLCVGGFFAYKYSKNIGHVLAPSNAKNTLELKTEEVSINEENKEANYKITATYPKFSGIKNAEAQDLINETLKKDMQDNVEIIKNDFTACKFDNLVPKPEWQCEYNGGMDSFTTVNNKILSVKISNYQFSGGAHGGTNIYFLNFDLSTGKKIKWQDIFKKDSNYIEVLANYAKTDLTKQLLQGPDQMSDEDWVQRGTDQSDELNYTNNIGFLDENKGLTIIFGQYQVAAYAVGMPEVIIPYAQLKNILDPAGLLGELAK